jgi:hypothetical protein
LFITVMANLPIGIGNDHRQSMQIAFNTPMHLKLWAYKNINVKALSIQNL